MLSAVITLSVATLQCGWRHNRNTKVVHSVLVLRQLLSILQRPRQIGTELSHGVLNPARTALNGEQPYLGTCSSPGCDEPTSVPNPAVDMNSWAGSACYPRSTFYSLSDGLSTQDRRITMTCFHLLEVSFSIKIPLFIALCAWFRQARVTFVRLRYRFEATAPVKLPTRQGPFRVR